MATTRRQWMTVTLAGMVSAALGCRRNGPKEYSIPVKPMVGVELARSILQSYVDGKPLGSEFMRFPEIVDDTKKQDAKKAETLDRGFQEIVRLRENPSAIPAKAKEILAQLE